MPAWSQCQSKHYTPFPLFTNLHQFIRVPAWSLCQSKHYTPFPLFTNLQRFIRVPAWSQCQSKHQLPSASFYQPSVVHQSAGIQRLPACYHAKHCHCVSLIPSPFSSQTFSGSSGCQQTAMPGAVSLNIMLPSPFRLHTRHVRSSPVLANWSSSPGAKVTELTKSVWPFRTWRHQEKIMTLLRVTDKFNFIIEIDTAYCHL